MADTDAIIADVAAALTIPEGAILGHIVIVAEYYEPGSDNEPGRPRLVYTTDDTCTPWSAMGMLRYAEQLEYHAIADVDDDL